VDCPVCKNPMITLELNDVEIDYCGGCSGIWLDAGELELLLADPVQAKKLIDSFAIDSGCAEKRRKCPICFKKMQKVVVGSDEPVLLIDRCPRGHGLWFDEGELQDICERAQLDEDNKIRNLLADMFGEDVR